MSESKCPYHTDHENRIERLEGEMKEMQKNQTNPAIYVALFSLVGTILSTVGAFCGVVTVAYFKSRGWM